MTQGNMTGRHEAYVGKLTEEQTVSLLVCILDILPIEVICTTMKAVLTSDEKDELLAQLSPP